MAEVRVTPDPENTYGRSYFVVDQLPVTVGVSTDMIRRLTVGERRAMADHSIEELVARYRRDVTPLVRKGFEEAMS